MYHTYSIHAQGVSACHVLLLFHFAKSSSLLLRICLSAPEPVSAHNILLNVLSTHGLLIPEHVRIFPPSSVRALLVQLSCSSVGFWIVIKVSTSHQSGPADKVVPKNLQSLTSFISSLYWAEYMSSLCASTTTTTNKCNDIAELGALPAKVCRVAWGYQKSVWRKGSNIKSFISS